MSQLLDILGSKYPIIQGPIGELNDPKMVATVSEAGAFGMLALGFVTDLTKVKQLVAEVKALTDKPFGANLMIAMNPINEVILEVLAKEGIKTVTTSAGSPKKIYPKIKELGLKVLHVTLAAPLAVKAAEAGADGVIVSGTESGGLRTTGPESTNMILIPLVCDMVNVPVVAAGLVATDQQDCRPPRIPGSLGSRCSGRTDWDCSFGFRRKSSFTDLERSHYCLWRCQHDATAHGRSGHADNHQSQDGTTHCLRC